MQLRAMKQLAAQTAEEVLRAQVATVARVVGDNERLPQVRVTVGPHAFAGTPVRIDDRRGVPWLVLVYRDTVAYLPLRSISTVVVENHDVPEVKEAPTRLAIERSLVVVQSALRERGWPGELAIVWPATIAEDHRRTIEAAVHVLEEVVEAVRRDELGRTSFAALQRVVLVAADGTELAVRQRDGALEITIGLAATVDVAPLRQLIEQQL